MDLVQLESNHREAKSLGLWFAFGLVLIGAALFGFLHMQGQLSAEQGALEQRYASAEDAEQSIRTLDRSTEQWLLGYSIDQQRADQESIAAVADKITGVGVSSVGNLDPNDAYAVSKRYWTTVSEYALQQSLLKGEASTSLNTLLDQAASQKPSSSLLKVVARLPEQHRAYTDAMNEQAASAIKRDVNALSKLAPKLSKTVEMYQGLIERMELLRSSYQAAVSELQAKRFERAFDLVSMLKAIKQQARAQLNQIDQKIEQLRYGFYGIVGVIALVILFRASVTARTMRLQSEQIQRNQTYMQNRMEISEANERAKTSFLSVISYEARTALDAVLGLTRLAQHSATNPDQEAKLSEVIASSTKLNNLLDDVLNFIDLELGSVNLDEDPFSPKDALALLMNKYARQAKNKNILFEHDIDPSLNDVYLGDQKRFYQVIDCLLSNAVHYTEKGHVIFSLSVDSGQSLSPEVQRLNLRIEDTGMALSKDEAQSLFDPFSAATFKSSRKSGGAGVRLSTAARLIGMMNGEVEVESSTGHGLVFNFYLNLTFADPSAKPVSTTSLEDTISKKSVDLQKLKVMVVEDNLTNSSLLKWILEDLEHDVDVAENGVECLNLIESKDYDLIFMDQHMPEMDGEEATKRIRARTDHKADIPIVGCTADAFQETRDLLAAAGQNDVIAKPISNDIVFEITQKFLSGEYKQALDTEKTDLM